MKEKSGEDPKCVDVSPGAAGSSHNGTIRFFTIIGGLLLAGFLYLIFVRMTGVGFHCPMYDLTGKKCITCGITGLFVHLSKGQFSEAFHDNRFVFITLPLIVFEIGYVTWTFCHGKKMPRVNVVILWALLICGLIFMILRNFVMW